MLSKLLSNITTGQVVAGDKAEAGQDGTGSGMNTSKQVFQSLLQSLQNENEGSSDKQKLLSMLGENAEGESAEGKNVETKILGGSFLNIDTGKKSENGSQATQGIVEQLKKELQNTEDEDQPVVKPQEKETKTEEGENASAKNAESKQDNSQQENGHTESTESEDQNVKSEDGTKNELAKSEENVKISSKVDQAGKNIEEKAGNSEEKQVRKEEKTTDKAAKKAGETPPDNQNKQPENNNQSENTTLKEKQAVAAETDTHNNEQRGSTSDRTDTNRENTDGRIISASGNSEKKTEKAYSDSETSRQPENAGQKLNAEAVPQSVTEQKGEVQKQETERDPLLKDNTDTKPRINGNQENQFASKVNSDGQKVRVENIGQKTKNVGQSQDQHPQPDSMRAGREAMPGKTAKAELTEQQKKVVNSFFQKNISTNNSAKGLEMKSIDASKKKEKTKVKNDSTARNIGGNASESRDKFLNRLGISNAQAQQKAKPIEFQGFTGISVGGSDLSIEEQKVSWEEQVTKSVESNAEHEPKTGNGRSSMRLGQMPIANVSLRKKVLPGLTQNIQKAAASEKENPGNWQKHNFVLDDGKNIQLSVRESKGVLQVKMGSMNLDLSKLLQQNLQQIRDHLKQEYGSDIDLQFENQQQGDESQFSEDTESSDRKRNYRNSFRNDGNPIENVEEITSKTVRNFGYNQMEWTA